MAIYKFEPDKAVEITFRDTKPVETEGKWGTQWRYFCIINGKDTQFYATPGLQKALEKLGNLARRRIRIKRTGRGTDTRWELTSMGEDKSNEHADGYGQMKQRYMGILFDLWKELKDNPILEHIQLNAIASSLFIAAERAGYRDIPGTNIVDTARRNDNGKVTPVQFVIDVFKKAEVHPTLYTRLLSSVFGKEMKMTDIGRDEAKVIYDMTKGGEDLEGLNPFLEDIRPPENDEDMPF